LLFRDRSEENVVPIRVREGRARIPEAGFARPGDIAQNVYYNQGKAGLEA
jgi:hypothetical protein